VLVRLMSEAACPDGKAHAAPISTAARVAKNSARQHAGLAPKRPLRLQTPPDLTLPRAVATTTTAAATANSAASAQHSGANAEPAMQTLSGPATGPARAQ
jgi:hypothetical protein